MEALDPQQVETREDLARFLERLSREANRRLAEFENQTLEDYFDAAAGWVQALPGAYLNRGETMPATPSWSLVAQIFHAATQYE